MLIGAFSLVLIFAFLLAWLSVGYRMRVEFADLVNRGDLEAARALALTLSSGRPEQWRKAPLSGMGMRPMMPGSHMPPRQRIVVTDAEGLIVFHTFQRLPREVEEIVRVREGEEIIIDGKKEGEVFIGSMIGDGLLPYQERFLKAVGMSLLFSALISMAAAIGMVVFITYRIVKPIGELNLAAKRIGEGDLSVRIPPSPGPAVEFEELKMQFNQMAANLNRSEERQKQLIADVSHELRTPVALLKSRLELLSDGLYTADPGQLGRLMGDVDRLSSLIEELRIVSRYERDHDRLNLEESDAVLLCARAAERFRPAAKEKGVDILLRTALGEGEGTLRVDRGKIDRVFDNLLSNALRFAPPGSAVTLDAARSGSGFDFSVRDEGPGLASEDTDRLFERFYRGEGEDGTSKGRGLGLAIARSIVTLHGGEIAFRASDSGALITFHLPA
jgi:signal transduction histidine kinase